jgi:hypothetical protein
MALFWNLFLTGRDFSGRYAVMGAPASSMWQAGFDWVKNNVPPNEGVLCENDPLLFLLTGRKGISDRNAMRIVWTGFYPHWEGMASRCPDTEKQLAEIRSMNIRWALDVGDPNAEKGFGFPSIVRMRPDAWELYYTAGLGTFHVYKRKQ